MQTKNINPHSWHFLWAIEHSRVTRYIFFVLSIPLRLCLIWKAASLNFESAPTDQPDPRKSRIAYESTTQTYMKRNRKGEYVRGIRI